MCGANRATDPLCTLCLGLSRADSPLSEPAPTWKEAVALWGSLQNVGGVRTRQGPSCHQAVVLVRTLKSNGLSVVPARRQQRSNEINTDKCIFG